MHIGHLVGSLQNRVALQDEYEQFIMIANVQALTDNFDNPEKVKESITEVLCDYYAVGIDFDISTVFIQSEVPQIHEIFMYLANFATLQQLSHNPTLKTEIGQKKISFFYTTWFLYISCSSSCRYTVCKCRSCASRERSGTDD